MDPTINGEQHPDNPDLGSLYRHAKREEWGVAVFLWERDDKRAYQFADGEVRVFKQGFYELMVPAIAPADGSADGLRALLDGGQQKEIIPSVGDQLVLLLTDFPKGFVGDNWLDQHRGKGRRLKRHRDAAIAQARELLAPGRISKLDEARDYTAVLESLADVLAATDLVPASHAKGLAAAKPTRELSAAIRRLAEDPERWSMTDLQVALIGAQGPAASWQVLTAPAALLAPDLHLCVRPSALTIQAKFVKLRFQAPKRPSAAGYERYLEIARLVDEELGELGYPPNDLLDVHDFIVTTLRPGAREQLERIHLQAERERSESDG